MRRQQAVPGLPGVHALGRALHEGARVAQHAQRQCWVRPRSRLPPQVAARDGSPEAKETERERKWLRKADKKRGAPRAAWRGCPPWSACPRTAPRPPSTPRTCANHACDALTPVPLAPAKAAAGTPARQRVAAHLAARAATTVGDSIAPPSACPCGCAAARCDDDRPAATPPPPPPPPAAARTEAHSSSRSVRSVPCVEAAPRPRMKLPGRTLRLCRGGCCRRLLLALERAEVTREAAHEAGVGLGPGPVGRHKDVRVQLGLGELLRAHAWHVLSPR